MIDKEALKKIKPGSLVTVVETFTYGDKKRTNNFKGMVIAKKHGTQSGASFTVRSVIDGVFVEKVFMANSPVITSIKINALPKKTRRAKLYFVRGISKKKMQKKLGVSI